MPNECATMKEIGKMFGMTSHKVGKALKEMGFRTEEGKPSDKAFALGLVEQKWTQDHQHYLWAWHRQKTVGLLEQAGLRRIASDVP